MTQRKLPARLAMDLTASAAGRGIPDSDATALVFTSGDIGWSLLHFLGARFESRACLIETPLHIDDPELAIFHLSMSRHGPKEGDTMARD